MKGLVCWVILTGALILNASCKKNKDQVPNVLVDEYINLNLPEYINLNAINNWVYYNYAGNKGIIIIRTSPSEFNAYERTCTYDPSVASAYVKGIPNDIFCVDSTCGSQFSLIDGSVTIGPATVPLLKYKTQLLTNNILHIYN